MSGWTVTIACTRAEAEALPETGELFADMADPPTLMVDEPDPDRPDDWVMIAYLVDEPCRELVERIADLAPSAGGGAKVEALPEADWTTLSQRDLEPVRAGRFVIHTAAHASAVRPNDHAIAIEAGLAFGTGQHMTTAGCLRALDRLGKARRFHNIVDLGTGTGVLAIAAARAWPEARTIASDIDPISIAVTSANLRTNHVRRGRGSGHIELVEAAGPRHRRLTDRALYDLVIANILAGPLIAMSRDVAAIVAPGGVLVLAGLLAHQARAVRSAYRKFGLVPSRQHPRGEWPTLVLTRKIRRATRETAGFRQ